MVIVLVGVPIIYLKYKWDLRKKQSTNGDVKDSTPENVELETVHTCAPEDNPKAQIGTNMCGDPNLTNLSSAQLTTKGERTISSEISLEVMIGAGKWKHNQVHCKKFNQFGKASIGYKLAFLQK